MAAKPFIEPVFNLNAFRDELQEFHSLLGSKAKLGEREIQRFLKPKHQLTSLLGTFSTEIGPADRIGFEFPVFGDFVADVIVGRKERGAYLLIELEDALPNSLFVKVGKKSTREWGRRFEHGFSQLVDWFRLLDDVKNTERFAGDFGRGHVSWEGMLIVGRSDELTDAERGRLKWRANRVTINGHKITCFTYDDVYTDLNRQLGYYTAASGQL